MLFFLFSGFYYHESFLESDIKPIENLYASNKNFIQRLLPRDEAAAIYVKGHKIQTFSLVKTFYEARKYKCFWTKKYLPVSFADEMITFLTTVRNYGLEPSFYHLKELEELRSALILETERKQYRQMSYDFEVLLTNSCFLLMSHLSEGVLKTDTLLNENRFLTTHSDFPELLENSNDAFDCHVLLELQPKMVEYVRLQKALENYLENNELQFDSISIPDPTIDSLGCIGQTKEILFEKGYLSSKTTGNSSFVHALKQFQKASGILSDGIIGKDTRNALAMNSYDWYLKAAINLERLKWDNYQDSNFVMINIPSFQLKIYENDSIKKVYKVIVGTSYTRTPEITSRIDQIITHPVWTVPRSIAVWEILPHIKRNPNYLKTRRYYRFYNRSECAVDPNTINWKLITAANFNYKIKQDRGGSNPLGMIKFNFKSPFSIYLHDTSEKSLFDKEIRSLSHGCIRLQNPRDFLNYLLARENDSLKTDSINYFLDHTLGEEFNLTYTIPIYIRYYTCFAGDKGSIQFYKDIYLKDERLKNSFLHKDEIDPEMIATNPD